MSGGYSLGQSFLKIFDRVPQVQQSEWRGVGMGALATRTDRVTASTVFLDQSFSTNDLRVFASTGRRCNTECEHKQ
ncbi:hypothetical protein MPL3356_540061 [Mesorhizobium plurifarium]|uniref:Uncharacterized protein n=1 Tax=Mesorhizobium plurifarium TaxID=69974 RepID=A0A090ECE9_MESPL|nr:hypothetical protein MPL3356_540061 [Mesorhizobium plurifarium]